MTKIGLEIILLTFAMAIVVIAQKRRSMIF